MAEVATTRPARKFALEDTMLGKTHVAVGVATALAVLHPTGISGCMCAVAGGALGGWISDIDVRESGRAHDVWQGAVMAVGASIAALGYDTYKGGSALSYVMSHVGPQTVFAVVVLFALCVMGARSPHRSFTHSFLGMALFVLTVQVLCAPLAMAFAVGFASHIALDVLNHRRVRLLYPIGRGWVLGICHSSGIVNNFLFCLAVTASVGLIIWLVMPVQ